jgi:biotin carboxyl carrier protein
MRKIQVTLDGQEYAVELRAVAGDRTRFVAVVDGEELEVYVPQAASDGDAGVVEWMVVNRRPYELVLSDQLHWLQSGGGMHELEVRWADGAGGNGRAAPRPAGGDGRVKAPIPGLITRLLVEAGTQVEAGAPLLVLEAMKMENEIRAPRPGVVTLVNVKPGQTVMLGEVMVEVG